MTKETNLNKKLSLRKTEECDIEIFFENQLDEEANRMAAFTPKNPADRDAYVGKWKRLLVDNTINMQTVMFEGEIAGTVVKFEIDGDPEITYALGKPFWGKGIATRALQIFLSLETKRPIFGRVAFDNFASIKVLEKCGFEKIGTDIGYANARGKEIEEIIYKHSK